MIQKAVREKKNNKKFQDAMLIELNQLNEILARRKIRKESRTRAKNADRNKL